MTQPCVEIKDLHKAFLLSHSGTASLKTMMLWWQRKRTLERLEVLRGVSFEVGKGECVSIIGRNGAGKSTLLSLVANVYKPTSGTVTVNGRVAPLLELGAGFHLDLSGAENILFNSMMLGLSRKEAYARMPQIIEFSEIGGHIDAPVRTYSSGMQARLGFSTAINVDADVLIVDEVLAVGDAAFERKCYDYIEGFKAKGGAILFVSHNLAAVERFSDRVVWLEGGLVRRLGPAPEVLPEYLAAMSSF